MHSVPLGRGDRVYSSQDFCFLFVCVYGVFVLCTIQIARYLLIVFLLIL